MLHRIHSTRVTTTSVSHSAESVAHHSPDLVAGRAQVLPRLVDALLHPDASPAAEPALRRGILAAISKVRRSARRAPRRRSRHPAPRWLQRACASAHACTSRPWEAARPRQC